LDLAVDSSAKRPPPAEIVAAIDAQADKISTEYAEGSMVWRSWGKGPPVLFLHGGSGSWTHWIRNVQAFAGRYRVIAPDMPGFGDSGPAAEPPSSETAADAVALGLPAVTDEPVTIVGFSFGSMVGAWLAKKLPDQVSGLVLVGAVGMGLRRNPIEFVSWRRLKDEERREAHRANLKALMIYDPTRIDDLAIHLQSENTRRTRINTRRFVRTTPLKDNLPDLDVALAGIWGEHDATAVPYLDERREFIHSLRPGAPFEVIKGIGHWVQYEGADEFNAALTRVLDSIRPSVGMKNVERARR
jgi:pimeloyl-ACP methyl ester carboxylesterase